MRSAKGLICPSASGPEAAWAGEDIDIIAPALADRHRQSFPAGTQVLAAPGACNAGRRPSTCRTSARSRARRPPSGRSRWAAARRAQSDHGPDRPGSGKSMLAARLPSILPPLSAPELLEVSDESTRSPGQLAGRQAVGPAAVSGRRITRPRWRRWFGGGLRAAARARCPLAPQRHPVFGRVSGIHGRRCSNSLRQPLENGESVHRTRANHRVSYPGQISS